MTIIELCNEFISDAADVIGKDYDNMVKVDPEDLIELCEYIKKIKPIFDVVESYRLNVGNYPGNNEYWWGRFENAYSEHTRG